MNLLPCRRLLALRLPVLALLLTLLYTSTRRAAAIDVAIDTGTRYQTIQGFGTCTIDWDSELAKTYSTPAFQDMYARDLGCSIMRLAVNPKVQPEEDLDLDHLNVDRLNFDAFPISTNGTLARALNARKLDEFKVIASVWSPPAWMKDNNSTTNGGRLRADRREHFGKYLAAFCTGFAQHFGVPIYAISIQNELRYAEPYDSCVYSPEQYRDSVRAVAAQFRKWGVKTRLQGPEDVGAATQYEVIQEMRYINQLQHDADTPSSLDLFNVHGYAGGGIAAGGSRASWSLLRYRLQGFDKEVWQTETSGEGTGWPDATLVGVSCNQALAYGNCNAWLYWQTIEAKPSAFALTAGSDKSARKYCAAKHFFRYIRPGAVRVGATGDNETFTVSAYVHDANKTLTIVMINSAAEPQRVNVALPAYPNIGNYRVWRTSAAESFAMQPDATPIDNKLSLRLPGQSIVTLYGAGTGLLPTALTPPTNLIAAAGAAQAELSWTAAWSAASGANRYTVKRGTSGAGPFKTIAVGLPTTHFTDTGLTNGTAYYYTVAATGKAGTSHDTAVASVTPDIARIAMTATAPLIDGAVDAAWAAAAVHPIAHVVTGSVGTDVDLSGQYRALWDRDNLYLLVDVMDDTLINKPGEPFNSDSIEVFVDGDNSKSVEYDKDDFQFVFPWGEATPIEAKHNATNGVAFAQAKTSTGYRVEIKLPFATLSSTAVADALIGLDVQVNDADTPTTRAGKKAWWAMTDNAWAEPPAFGSAKLLGAAK